MRSLCPLWMGLCWLCASFAPVLIYMWWSLWRYEVTICQGKGKGKGKLSPNEAYECLDNGGLMSMAAVLALVFLRPLLLTKLPAIARNLRNITD